ncbi:MAG: hypothetical protein IJW59_04990 [Clostridia bacterium]|nr:hypothetical protein [Clostridia bacterium]
MRNDRYFFDKRDWKRRFIKIGIIFLISFIPIVLFNVYCSDYLGHEWLVVLLDCVFLLVFVCIGSVIIDKIYARKDAKLDRLRKEREEVEARKKKIMEDSYKRKREEKEKIKAQKKQEQDVVVVEEPSQKKRTRRK